MVFMYYCKDCDWKGHEKELVYDNVDTCMGNDQVETCPRCGSYNIVRKID